jgi:hypothetical protein
VYPVFTVSIRYAVPDGSGSTAIAINSEGEIVGVSSGFATNGGGVVRAVDHQSGLTLTQATAINNRGQIVVEEQATDRPPSFLLTP